MPIHQNNEHLKENDIKEENIQEAIDNAGVSAGIALNVRLQQINQFSNMIQNPKYKLYIEAEHKS